MKNKKWRIEPKTYTLSSQLTIVPRFHQWSGTLSQALNGNTQNYENGPFIVKLCPLAPASSAPAQLTQARQIRSSTGIWPQVLIYYGTKWACLRGRTFTGLSNLNSSIASRYLCCCFYKRRKGKGTGENFMNRFPKFCIILAFEPINFNSRPE